MQFRLRTLLILMTVACVLLARFAHVRNMAAFHRREAARLSQRFATIVRLNPEWVWEDVERYANYDSNLIVNPWNNPWDLEDDDDERVLDWKNAVYHKAMAMAYERAVIFPVPRLTVVASDSPEAEVKRLRARQENWTIRFSS